MKTKVIHAFLWILVCMVLGITCYQCRDLRGYVILSGSMEPVIPTGSVAVVDSSKRDVRPGNIATFERHGDLVTHRILSKDVQFKDLGLLIIDEEQRFGVTHKEKIKQMKHTCSAFHILDTDLCGQKITCFLP